MVLTYHGRTAQAHSTLNIGAKRDMKVLFFLHFLQRNDVSFTRMGDHLEFLVIASFLKGQLCDTN